MKCTIDIECTNKLYWLHYSISHSCHSKKLNCILHALYLSSQIELTAYIFPIHVLCPEYRFFLVPISHVLPVEICKTSWKAGHFLLTEIIKRCNQGIFVLFLYLIQNILPLMDYYAFLQDKHNINAML